MVVVVVVVAVALARKPPAARSMLQQKLLVKVWRMLARAQVLETARVQEG